MAQGQGHQLTMTASIHLHSLVKLLHVSRHNINMTVLFVGDDIITLVMAAWLLLGVTLHVVVGGMILFCIHRKRIGCRYLVIPLRDKFSKYFQFFLCCVAVTFAIIAIIDTTSGNCSSEQQHFGLFTVALTWINLIRLFSKFPIIGQHAIIFGRIVWTFLNLALFAILVLLAATIILTTVFFNSQALVRKL